MREFYFSLFCGAKHMLIPATQINLNEINFTNKRYFWHT